LRGRGHEAHRVQDQVSVAPGGAQGADGQLVIRHLAGLAHQPALEAADAAHVRELNLGTQLAQGLCDGQRGVDVPAGPAA
jgi:hypothetical protein